MRSSLRIATSVIVVTLAIPALGALTPTLESLREQGEREGWTFEVGPTGRGDGLGQHATGLSIPADWKHSAEMIIPNASRALPSRLDWRELATSGLAPIKNQGTCGSCWAFSTVATMEDVLRIRDNISKNFSEQYLVSCNTDGYDCRGGWWGHKYHVRPGAVLEANFPYANSDLPCKANLPKDTRVDGWAYVTFKENVPSVTALKRAVLEYGPLTVGVDANAAFQSYKGGIFNDCSPAPSGQPVNHAINIIGWDDKDGAFIVRNSWSESWGEEGFGRVKYGCRNLGYAASFVTYGATCQPQPSAETGTDVTIKRGQSVTLGGETIPGATYQWSPASTLDDPTQSEVTATPASTTTYTLRVDTPCGAALRAVTVTVTP
jgi:hypothetical protein